MSKSTKTWLIVAASLVLVGCIIFGGALATVKWDFTKLSTTKFETNEYKISQKFKNISIDTDTADVVFVPIQEQTVKVECIEQKNINHTVEVKDDTLCIELVDTREWFENIGFSFGSTKITVYLPQSEYGELSVKLSTGDVETPKDFTFDSIDIAGSTGHIKNYASASGDVKLKTTTGSIFVEDVSASSLDLAVTTGKVTASRVNCSGDINVKVSTGDAELSDITCLNFTSAGSTGDLTLTNVVATENFSIERSTGDINFAYCDANELLIKTDTGDVNGSLLSDKVFITSSDTGSVDVPKTTTGGKCEITTDTGDISINIE